MKHRKRQSTRVWRFPPCPAYDVEATESWLQSMAAQGLHLSEDGFFAGFACFDRGEPKQTRYRLEAAPGAAGEGPDEQARELTEAAGWRFTARRGDFLIYASDEPGGVELHTDPRVQALSLNLIRKRARRSVFSLIPWLLLCFFFSQRMLLTAWVQIGTPLSLLGAVLVLWAIGSTAASVLSLRRLWKKLRGGQAPDHRKDWRRKARRYRLSFAAYLVLAAVYFISLLRLWSLASEGAFETPLAAYADPIPFATMEDLVPGSVYVPESQSVLADTVEEHRDLLAPVQLRLTQHGTLRLDDKTVLSGGWNAEYYETAAPWMARQIAREYIANDRRRNRNHFSEIVLPEPVDADFVSVYSAVFPTAVVVQGNCVAHVTFYQTNRDESRDIPAQTWVSLLAESLREP